MGGLLTTVATAAGAAAANNGQDALANQPAPDVMIITSFSNRIDKVLPAWNVTQKYADRWGYRMELRTQHQSELAIEWERFPIILSLLKEPNVKAVLYVDDDSFVNYQEVSIDSWLKEMNDVQHVTMGVEKLNLADSQIWGAIGKGRDVLSPPSAAWDDDAYALPNTGVMLFHNSQWTREFLATYSETAKDMACEYPTFGSDQRCLAKMLAENKNEELDQKPFRDHFRFLELDKFQCQPKKTSYAKECDPWVFHAMGLPKECVSEIARQHLTLKRPLSKGEIEQMVESYVTDSAATKSLGMAFAANDPKANIHSMRRPDSARAADRTRKAFHALRNLQPQA
mmetsp:Transcript_18169/g.46519  ORF Transcript_18169/g.46519 Transcript_18169/m.46519 type:complete len:341 (+) Transcript_18169:20-1042(+)